MENKRTIYGSNTAIRRTPSKCSKNTNKVCTANLFDNEEDLELLENSTMNEDDKKKP